MQGQDVSKRNMSDLAILYSVLEGGIQVQLKGAAQKNQLQTAISL